MNIEQNTLSILKDTVCKRMGLEPPLVEASSVSFKFAWYSIGTAFTQAHSFVILPYWIVIAKFNNDNEF